MNIIQQIYIFVCKRKMPISKIHVVNGRVAGKPEGREGTIAGFLTGAEVMEVTYPSPDAALADIRKCFKEYKKSTKEQQIKDMFAFIGKIRTMAVRGLNYYKAIEAGKKYSSDGDLIEVDEKKRKSLEKLINKTFDPRLASVKKDAEKFHAAIEEVFFKK